MEGLYQLWLMKGVGTPAPATKGAMPANAWMLRGICCCSRHAPDAEPAGMLSESSITQPAPHAAGNALTCASHFAQMAAVEAKWEAGCQLWKYKMSGCSSVVESHLHAILMGDWGAGDCCHFGVMIRQEMLEAACLTSLTAVPYLVTHCLDCLGPP